MSKKDQPADSPTPLTVDGAASDPLQTTDPAPAPTPAPAISVAPAPTPGATAGPGFKGYKLPTGMLLVFSDSVAALRTPDGVLYEFEEGAALVKVEHLEAALSVGCSTKPPGA